MERMLWSLLSCYLLSQVEAISFEKTPRGALLLTMAGKTVPPYLQASCQSIASSSQRFDMLIFHEDNTIIENMACAPNVKKINLHSHGLAQLIADTLCFPQAATNSPEPASNHNNNNNNNNNNQLLCKELGVFLDKVLQRLPYYLAEFKIGSGAIFRDFLHEYSHWTYTDPDVIWGNLTSWISDAELREYDIITMAKQNDARRLFLRGQFALHKNSHGLNWKWSTLPHMTAALVLTRMKRVLSLLESRYPIDILKRMTFISAEGEYSSHIFDSLEFTILIAGRMMSDRVTQPVLWQQGALGRCKCPTVATCVSKEGSERRCIEMPTVTNRSHHEKRKMHLLPVNTTRGRHCGMNWLARKDQLCTESAPSSSMRANDAVLLKIMYIGPCESATTKNIPIHTWREWRMIEYKEWRTLQKQNQIDGETDDFFYHVNSEP